MAPVPPIHTNPAQREMGEKVLAVAWTSCPFAIQVWVPTSMRDGPGGALPPASERRETRAGCIHAPSAKLVGSVFSHIIVK